jgi:hypothetical protein
MGQVPDVNGVCGFPKGQSDLNSANPGIDDAVTNDDANNGRTDNDTGEGEEPELSKKEELDLILSFFRNWDHLDSINENTKKTSIEALAQYLFKDWGINPQPTIAFNCDSSYDPVSGTYAASGTYNWGTNQITINKCAKSFKSGSSVFTTVAHEVFHALQYLDSLKEPPTKEQEKYREEFKELDRIAALKDRAKAKAEYNKLYPNLQLEKDAYSFSVNYCISKGICSV